MTKQKTPHLETSGAIRENTKEKTMRTTTKHATTPAAVAQKNAPAASTWPHGLEFLDRAATAELGEQLLDVLKPALDAIPARDVERLNFRLGDAAKTALVACPKIGRLMPELKAKTSYSEAALLRLHNVALASTTAAARWAEHWGAVLSDESPVERRIAEAMDLRGRALKLAKTCYDWTFLTVEEYRSLPKNRTLAGLPDDLAAINGLLLKKRRLIEPKLNVVPWDELEHGITLGHDLRGHVEDDTAMRRIADADRCRRLGLLLRRDYKLARSTIEYARMEEGDAASFAPGLKATRRNGAKKADAPKGDAKVTEAASNDPKDPGQTQANGEAAAKEGAADATTGDAKIAGAEAAKLSDAHPVA